MSNPGFLTKRGGAEYTGLSIRMLDYARSAGALPFYRVGARVLFSIPDLDDWMLRHRVSPATEPDAARHSADLTLVTEDQQ